MDFWKQFKPKLCTLKLTGADKDAIIVNDPWIARDKGKSARDMKGLRVPRATFEKMTRYGKVKERAAVLLRR